MTEKHTPLAEQVRDLGMDALDNGAEPDEVVEALLGGTLAIVRLHMTPEDTALYLHTLAYHLPAGAAQVRRGDH